MRWPCHSMLAATILSTLSQLDVLGFAQSLPPTALTVTASAPPKGWILGGTTACDLSEAMIKDATSVLTDQGFLASGFEYLVLNDCWQGPRDENGHLTSDSTKFPSGMKALADLLHSHNFKLGLTVTMGSRNCSTKNAAMGVDAGDSATIASWDVDLLRINRVNNVNQCKHAGTPGNLSVAKLSKIDDQDRFEQQVQELVASLKKLGAKTTIHINDVIRSDDWATDNLNSELDTIWRTSHDVTTDQPWSIMFASAAQNNRFAALAGPGNWNDPGLLFPGNLLSIDEKRSQLSLWIVMASPLFLEGDPRTLPQEVGKLLTHPEAMELTQDRVGLQGVLVRRDVQHELWVRPLAQPGHRAIVVLNKSEVRQTIKVDIADLGLKSDDLCLREMSIRDLWQGRTIKPASALALVVEPHGSTLLKIEGRDATAGVGRSLLSKWPWIYAANYQDTVIKDPTAKDPTSRDISAMDPHGQALSRSAPKQRGLTIAGIRYSQGLGVGAPSVIRYFLDGHCQRFNAIAGLDDISAPEALIGFEVWGDGRRLFSSGRINQKRRVTPIDVGLTGVGYLDLVVQAGGHQFDNTYANWAHATLTCRE